MPEPIRYGLDNPHPLSQMKTELIWAGKYDATGRKVAPVRVKLPFQTVETVNESSQQRQMALDLFSTGRAAEWRNRLIWGDKKYVLPALPSYSADVRRVAIPSYGADVRRDAIPSYNGVIQLDVSATPRYSKGSLFTWTVFDYPLKQAIIDNVTKRPIKGIMQGVKEAPSDIASVRYQAYLTAGVERWREYRDQLAKLKRKPVLFLMLNNTHDADDVADYLRVKYPTEFAGDKLLVIHTDRSGDVAKGDLDAARKAAQEIDYGKSPINAIVSVLMLREGWDVQGVTVVVGLRPYNA
jgi:hypothetical protein